MVPGCGTLTWRACVKSEVLYEIWRLFRQEGIQIPYPKRDLYVRSDFRT